MSILVFSSEREVLKLKKKHLYLYSKNNQDFNSDAALFRVLMLLRTGHSEMRLDKVCHVYEAMEASGYSMEILNQKLLKSLFNIIIQAYSTDLCICWIWVEDEARIKLILWNIR